METITDTVLAAWTWFADRPWTVAAAAAAALIAVAIGAFAFRGDGYFVITSEPGDEGPAYFVHLGDTRTKRAADREAADLDRDEPGLVHTVVHESRRAAFE